MRDKILLIDNSIAFTGAFKCALQEAKLLSHQFEFIFLLPKHSAVKSLLVKEGFAVYELPMLEISKSISKLLLYIPYLLMNGIKLKSILKKEKVTVIQVNDIYNLLGIISKLIGFRGKLITYVRFLPNNFPTPLKKCWTFLAQRYSFRVVAVSDAVLKQLPVHKNTIRIYDAAVLEKKQGESKSSQLTVENEKVQLLYLANYIRGKGQNFAIKAFAAAYSSNPNLRLLFVGSDMGLEKNRLFKAELQNEVQTRKLHDVVHFNDFATDVEQLIKTADIVLNFSESESFSMTCLEASFYGTPVIATKCGGPAEIIADHVTGCLVENRNVQEMTAAIIELASSKELRYTFAKNGRAYVSEKFSVENFVQEYTACIHTDS